MEEIGATGTLRAPIRQGLFVLVATFAAITLLTEACRAAGSSFALFSWLAGALTLAVPAASILLLRGSPVAREPKTTLAAVVLLGAACSVLAVVTLRLDADDFFYLPDAIYHLQHPAAAMGYEVTFLHSPDRPFQSHWSSIPFEYYPAALAHLLGLRYLDLYYVFQPALFGFLLPVVLYFLLSTLVGGERGKRGESGRGEPKVAPFALVVSVASLLLLGDTHWTPLNMSITRFFQGKTVLLSLGVPLFIAAAVQFLRAPRREGWVFLCLLCVALCGCSYSTLLLLPPLGGALGLAYLVTNPGKESLQRVLVYLASLAYLAVLAVELLADPSSPRPASATALAVAGLSYDLKDHLAYFLNPRWPLTPLLLVTAAIVAITLTPRPLARFLTAFCAALLATVFNPWLAPALIRWSSSAAVYWRLLYLLPVGMFVGLAANEIQARCTTGRSRAALWWLTGAVLLLAYLVTPYSVARARAAWSAELGGRPPRDLLSALWKLRRQDLDAARDVLAVTPPGAMLAPDKVGSVIPLLDSRYPQLSVREYARWFLTLRHEPAYGEQRFEAAALLAGSAAPPASFAAVMQRECGALRSVVMAKAVAADPRIEAWVRRCGLTERRETASHAVAYRGAP